MLLLLLRLLLWLLLLLLLLRLLLLLQLCVGGGGGDVPGRGCLSGGLGIEAQSPELLQSRQRCRPQLPIAPISSCEGQVERRFALLVGRVQVRPMPTRTGRSPPAQAQCGVPGVVGRVYIRLELEDTEPDRFEEVGLGRGFELSVGVLSNRRPNWRPVMSIVVPFF